MKVKQISIKHPEQGEIQIHTSIPKDIGETIGDVVSDYSKGCPFYHAKVVKNEDETFSIDNLKVIKPDSVRVGWMENSKGKKTFITVVKNIPLGDNVVIYPNGVISVGYN